MGKGIRLALICGLLLCAIPAHAAIAHVAHDVIGGATNSSSTTLSVATTAGNLAVVCVMIDTFTSVTVSGNASGSYTASSAGAAVNGTTSVELFYKQNAGADTVITLSASPGSSGQLWGAYQEFSGAASSGGEDGTATGTGTGTSLATGTLTSTGTTDVVIGGGGIATGSANTWTAASGFTLNNGTAVTRVSSEWEVFASAVNQTITMTASVTGKNWAMAASAFKAAGGAPACTPTLTLLGVGRCG